VEVFDFLDKKEPYQDAPTPDLIVLLPDLPCLGGYDVAQKLSCSEGYKKIPMMIFNPLRVPEKKHVEVAPELMRVHPFRYLIEAYFRQVQ
jgi:CheY-like chemotaxis protein